MVLTCDKPLEGDVLIMYAGSGSCIENQPQGLNHLQGHGNLRDSDSSKGFYKYIDLDGKMPMALTSIRVKNLNPVYGQIMNRKMILVI